MSSSQKKTEREPRIRWHISHLTVAGLERTRRLLGSKSWDGFFQELVRQWDYMPPNPSTKLDAVDMKLVLKKLDDHLEYLLKILGKLEGRDDILAAIQAGLDEIQIVQKAIRNLLAVSLGVALETGKEVHEKPEKSILQTRLEKRGRS